MNDKKSDAMSAWRQYLLAVVMVVSLQLVHLPVDAEELSTGEPAEFAEAMMLVKELHNKLLYMMQNAESLGYQGRYEEIDELVIARFDTPLIARVILSRYWKELDEEKKQDFIELFQRLSIATYASRFDGFDNESFVELSTEKLKKGRLLIKTQLQRVDDKPVNLDYLVHQKNGQWKIISVIANGVNDLSLKRAEYATVIKEKGFEGLVNDVAAKIADMENPQED